MAITPQDIDRLQQELVAQLVDNLEATVGQQLVRCYKYEKVTSIALSQRGNARQEEQQRLEMIKRFSASGWRVACRMEVERGMPVYYLDFEIA